MAASVAILYLCTGKYTVFWPDFYRSFEENFLPGMEKTYFVFTDAENIEFDEAEKVRRIYQQPYDWPYSTMKRFHVFLTQSEALAKFDYLFFGNANLRCCAPVGALELLPDVQSGRQLVVVRHPGYWDKAPQFLPYDRNPRCRAYIPYNCGSVYVAGGLNGGTAPAFLALCRELDARTEADLADGVIPRWHDESELNRLVAEMPERFRVLDPGYCMPEGVELPFETKVLVRQKANWIDVAAVKGKAKKQGFLQQKWGAFRENYLPNFFRWRDGVCGKGLR